MTDSVDRQAAIEAAAEAMRQHTIRYSHRQESEPPTEDVLARIALDLWTAPRWVTCPTCLGKRFVQREGWRCGCGRGVRHMRDCGRPAPFDPCPTCKDSEDGTVPADPWLTWTSDVAEMKAELERHRRANLVRAVLDGHGKKDDAITDLIHAGSWDSVPWRVAEAMVVERDRLREELAIVRLPREEGSAVSMSASEHTNEGKDTE